MTEDDLRLLDAYRRSFSESYEFVVKAIRTELGLEPTGRPAKSTTSISDKLSRESIRLTQIQDIAGCRLIVANIAEQDSVVQSLGSLFENVTVVDRRTKPSHGYRAVHVIVNRLSKMIEIQVRTSLQHLWAEYSEKFSDIVGPEIKYGGGHEAIQKALATTSRLAAALEEIEPKFADITVQLSSQASLPNDEKQKVVNVLEEINALRRSAFELFREHTGRLEKLRGKQ